MYDSGVAGVEVIHACTRQAQQADINQCRENSWRKRKASYMQQAQQTAAAEQG